MRAACLLGLLLWTATGPARAQSPTPDARPIKVLFVGNSFTHGKYLPVRKYNAAAVVDENVGLPADDPRAFCPPGEEGPYGGIPGIFKKLTDEAGLKYEVHIEAVSAKNLAFHYKNALSVITRPGWDVVVLQGSSMEPLPTTRGGKPENFAESAKLLEKAIHAANPVARVYLEETWARADLVYPEGSPYHGESISAMTADLRRSCHQVESALFRPTVEVGDAWDRAMREGVAQANPYRPAEPGKLDLWGPDHYHPSVYGAYLTAACLFFEVALADQTALRVDGQAVRDLGISPADAARLLPYCRVTIGGDTPLGR